MSYWTAPIKAQTLLQDVYYWGLASCLLKKHFPKTKLITDEKGRLILIDKLCLPFDQVDISLEGFTKKNFKHIWAAGKIKAYNLQTEPFLHIDHDVFWWKKPPQRILNGGLIAANEEFYSLFDKNHYRHDFYPSKEILRCCSFLPPIICNHAANSFSGIQRPYNMGIFGGNDIPFIKFYSRMSLNTMKNLNYGSLIPWLQRGTPASVFFEQYFFGAYAHKYHKIVETIIPDGATSQRCKEIGFDHYGGAIKSGIHARKFIKKQLEAMFPFIYEKCRMFEDELNLFAFKTVLYD